MLVSETVEDLFGGVSQAPHAKRAPNQFGEQINALPIFGKRLGRRPPLLHLAKLTSFSDNAFVHPVTTSTGRRVHLVITDSGTIAAFDADTGASITVDAPDGMSYVTGNTTSLRATSAGDSTIIVNPNVTVKKALTYSATAPREALIYIRQGDYETNYVVTIDGIVFTYTTPASTVAGATAAITTDQIAIALIALFVANTAINSAYSFTRYGSTIYAVRKNGGDFTIATTDGIADQALVLIKGTVQSYADLPAKCRPGVIVEVTGTEASDFTSYFVRYDITGDSTRNGVWHEVVKPGSLTALDGRTMPFRCDFRGKYMPDTRHRTTSTYKGIASLGSTTYGAGSASAAFPDGKYFTPGVRVTLSATAGFGVADFTYTTVGEETGDFVLQQLKTIVDAHLPTLWTSVINAAGALDFKRSDGTAVSSIAFTQGYNDNTVFYSPDAAFTPNQFVGKVIQNLTDGSSGTVTANDAHTITVLLLTGGGLNAFSGGDVCAVVGAGDYFLFAQGGWRLRQAGDERHVPFPSFVGRSINEAFFHQGRLGMISGSSFTLSRAGDLFNFFRRSAIQMVSDDPIDLQNATGDSSPFHSGIEWNDKLYLFSGRRQYNLSAETGVITPENVQLKVVSEYPSDARVRPIVAGNRLYFVASKSGFPRVLEYSLKDYGTIHEAEDIGLHVPTYFQGNPVALTVDESQGVLAFLTDGLNRKSLYIYSYRFQERQKVAAGWSRWDFSSGTIVSVDCVDGKMGMLTTHSDGTYLGSLLLDPQALSAYQRFDGSHLFDGSFSFGAGSDLGGERIAYLDRRVCTASGGVVVSYAGGVTTFTLPYALSVYGLEGTLAVCSETPVVVYATTRPAPNQVAVAGDLRNVTCYIGIIYATSHVLTTLFLRDKEGSADARGRLQVRYLKLHYADSTDLTVTVTLTGRGTTTYTLNSTTPSSGTLTVPVQAKNEDALIVVSTGTPGAGHLVSYEWAGTYHTVERAL